MNPWLLARAALRRRWASALTMALLIAVATGLGIGISALERASRKAAAQAADAFDLIVGAPGGPTQLVMAAVYLQPESVPLLDPSIVERVLAEKEAVWASPIGFGDSFQGHPVVGVSPEFIARGGTRSLAEGKVFEAEEEAVVGASVPMRLEGKFSPVHGLIEAPGHAGHVHSEIAYTVVGRLPPTGTPWDGAILVPIESVWEIHGLGNGHPPGIERVGPPWEQPSGVPAIVLKPRTFAGAYQLRARYRTAASTAVFPGEVLAGMFRTLGDVRSVLSGMAMATSVLVVVAVFLAFTAVVAGRAREHAVLRAIGAPPAFLVLALWLELGLILGLGVGVGIVLGWGAARAAGAALGRSAGIAVEVTLGRGEVSLAGFTLVAALVAAALPALVGSRGSPAALLKR